MDWHDTVFELIDMRSFSNLWYWIAVAAIWSAVNHWVLGVPYDMVMRARRRGGRAEADLQDIVRVNVNRLLGVVDAAGPWLLAGGCALLTGLALLGFWYGVELAQALFLLAFPLAIVAGLNLVTARRIFRDDEGGATLHRRLGRHRLATQAIAMVAIFVTALYGMYQNIAIGPLAH